MSEAGPVLLQPDWPAPSNVRAVCSTRRGGVSQGPWASLNLGRSSGDLGEHVDENRRRYARAAGMPEGPRWLSQVHGTRVVRWPDCDEALPEADAAVTTQPGVVCTVQAADCMPVLFCDRHGRAVAAAHAGWRGLAAGVLEATVGAICAAADVKPADILAWLGPCIGAQAFEVGAEVQAAFVAIDPAARQAFMPAASPGKFMADLRLLARQRLQGAGLLAVCATEQCTWTDAEQFFSFRRDGVTGRMAASVWLARDVRTAVV